MPQQFNAIDVPMGGKVYTCRPTHAALYRAERDLGLNIMAPGKPHLLGQPTGYMLAAIAWILLSTKIPTLELDDCFDLVTDNLDKFDKVGIEFVEGLNGVLPWIGKEEAKLKDPLAGTLSGESDGPALESSCESQTESSGD